MAEPKTDAIEEECDEHLQMEHLEQGEVAPNSTRCVLRHAFFFETARPRLFDGEEPGCSTC